MAWKPIWQFSFDKVQMSTVIYSLNTLSTKNTTGNRLQLFYSVTHRVWVVKSFVLVEYILESLLYFTLCMIQHTYYLLKKRSSFPTRLMENKTETSINSPEDLCWNNVVFVPNMNMNGIAYHGSHLPSL